MTDARDLSPTPKTPAPGGDDAFILAWGRQNAALAIYRWLLLLLMLVTLTLLGLVGFLAWRNEQKTVWCFVKDSLGNVVQADPDRFLRAGEPRTEVDIKGFTRRWVLDSHAWTPLDVKDKLNLALRVVEPKAREVVKRGLRLAERKALVDRGVSGRVLDVEGDPSRQPQVLIQSRKPLSVLVTFDTTRILPDGQEEPGRRILFTLFLKEVPRTPDNMAGLTIVDGTFPGAL
ncbi:hypothetical protein [Mesoterricola sediminis]|uniref:Uncharacterized protein n=1 Tax=Mesoterricola sediminis TaxID=2927980 RepID=A0AA48H6F4_9BACT|nr:hypothetical protein [Mesoterricola sediminis]BDU76843.1 hypothetical protein METESE_18010 [Mesoterricola sediminis]